MQLRHPFDAAPSPVSRAKSRDLVVTPSRSSGLPRDAETPGSRKAHSSRHLSCLARSRDTRVFLVRRLNREAAYVPRPRSHVLGVYPDQSLGHALHRMHQQFATAPVGASAGTSPRLHRAVQDHEAYLRGAASDSTRRHGTRAATQEVVACQEGRAHRAEQSRVGRFRSRMVRVTSARALSSPCLSQRTYSDTAHISVSRAKSRDLGFSLSQRPTLRYVSGQQPALRTRSLDFARDTGWVRSRQHGLGARRGLSTSLETRTACD